MVDQVHLLNGAGMRNFIKNGYVTVHPDLPGVHEEIYRETAAIFENEGDPRNHILQKVPGLYQVFAHPTVRGILTSLLGPDYIMHPQPNTSLMTHRHQASKRRGITYGTGCADTIRRRPKMAAGTEPTSLN